MRITVVSALFVVLLVLAFAALPTTPAAGETVPPTATATPDFPYPTPRPTVDGTPDPTATPDPNCPPEGCGPVPTPRPTDTAPSGPTPTPNPACPQNDCFPFPTPRPTDDGNVPIDPAKPGPGPEPGFWHYSFMPVVGRSR